MVEAEKAYSGEAASTSRSIFDEGTLPVGVPAWEVKIFVP